MKTRKLSISLLWKISLLFILSFFTVGYATIKNVRKYNRETIAEQNNEAVNQLLWIIANVNSVMMQQMRSYTMINTITSESRDPMVVQKELVRISKKRYKDFKSISYVDYASGLQYNDDGTIEDVSHYGYFKDMKAQRQKNKAFQLYGDLEEDWYAVCKDSELKNEDGYCIGFFIGKVGVSYLQRYMDKLKGKSFDDPGGFFVILNSDFMHICSPEKDTNLKHRFIPSKELVIDPKITQFIANPLDIDENKNKITVTGDVEYYGKKYIMTVGMFSKTNWTIGAVVPYSTIDKIANSLVLYIIIIAVIVISISLLIMYFLFSKMFKPLTVLNDSFVNIARGDADLTQRLNITDKHEIGIIQKSFNEYLTQLQNMVSQIGGAKNNLVKVESKLGVILKRTQAELESMNCTLGELKENDLIDKEIFKRLDASSASIEFITNELEQSIESSYEAVNKISENVEGFTY